MNCHPNKITTDAVPKTTNQRIRDENFRDGERLRLRDVPTKENFDKKAVAGYLVGNGELE